MESLGQEPKDAMREVVVAFVSAALTFGNRRGARSLVMPPAPLAAMGYHEFRLPCRRFRLH
jgi:hypothetical protein